MSQRTTTYDKWVVQHLQYLLFVFDVVDVLGRDDLVLFHRFNGELHVRITLQPAVFHVSERTYQ